jgi:hypothetical protein
MAHPWLMLRQMRLASAFAAGAFSGADPFSRKWLLLNFGVAPFDGRTYMRTGWCNLGPGHNTVCHVPTEPWLPTRGRPVGRPRLLSPDAFFGGKCPVRAPLARFEIYQGFQLRGPLPCGMTAFLYRCPNMALNVQGWVADDPTDGEAETYEPITCTACARPHLVNPKNRPADVAIGNS